MARLAAQIRAEKSALAKRPKIKYINSNTREYAYAAYMRAWAARVERVGTLNFPDAARTGRYNGSLILTVVLRRDGSIKHIAIIESSGRKVLDEAAERIVRMAGAVPADSAHRRALRRAQHHPHLPVPAQRHPGNPLRCRTKN